MISDDFVMYFVGMIVLLVINLIAYTRIPYLAIVGIIGTLLLTPGAIIGFGDYYFIAFILVLTNMMIPFLAINAARKGA